MEEEEGGGGGGLEGNLWRDQKSDKERISIFLKQDCTQILFFHCLKGTNMVKPKDMME